MFDEHADALVLEFANDTRTQVDNLLIVVGDPFVDDTLEDALLDIFLEETEQQIPGHLE